MENASRVTRWLGWLAGWLRQLAGKGLRYWTTALIVFVLSATGSPYIYDYLHLTQVQARFFQTLLEWGPRSLEPGYVSIVSISDRDYWLDAPAGRVPLKRDYLARLVRKLVAANAYVIALDVDTRLPDPRATTIPDEYRDESLDLIGALIAAAKADKKVVLATPIRTNPGGRYERDPDIYQVAGLCERDGKVRSAADLDADTTRAIERNVSCGYIALPFDPLAVPGPLRMADDGRLDSFAVAIARADRPAVTNELLRQFGDHPRYAGYISENKLEQYHAAMTAGDVLNASDEDNRQALQARAVIVGGGWRSLALGRGRRVDLHWTPVGFIAGAALHANFAEAILDRRIIGPVPHWVLHGSEILFSVLAVIGFALIRSLWGKLLGLASGLVVLFLVQWSLLHGFGVFFDALVPLVGLALHSLYERLIGEGHAAEHKESGG